MRMINKLFRILKMAFFAPVGLLVGIDPITAGAIAFGVGGGLNLFGGLRSAKKAKKAAEEAARQRAALLQGYTGLEIVEPTRTATGQINAANIKAGQVISPFAQQAPELQLIDGTYQMPEQAQQNLQLVQAETSKRALGMPDAEKQMILQKAREDFTKAKMEASGETAAQSRAMGLTGGIAGRRQQEVAEQAINEQLANFAYNLGLRSIDEAKQAQQMLVNLAQIETEEERYKYLQEISKTMYNNQIKEALYNIDANQIAAFNDLQKFNKGIDLDKIRMQIGSSDSYYSDMVKASTAKYGAISQLGSSIATLGFMGMMGGFGGGTSTTTSPSNVSTTATGGTIGASNIPIKLGYTGNTFSKPTTAGFDWRPNYKTSLF